MAKKNKIPPAQMRNACFSEPAVEADCRWTAAAMGIESNERKKANEKNDSKQRKRRSLLRRPWQRDAAKMQRRPESRWWTLRNWTFSLFRYGVLRLATATDTETQRNGQRGKRQGGPAKRLRGLESWSLGALVRSRRNLVGQHADARLLVAQRRLCRLSIRESAKFQRLAWPGRAFESRSSRLAQCPRVPQRRPGVATSAPTPVAPYHCLDGVRRTFSV